MAAASITVLKRTRCSAEDVSCRSVIWIRCSCRCYKVYCQHRKRLSPLLDDFTWFCWMISLGFLLDDFTWFLQQQFYSSNSLQQVWREFVLMRLQMIKLIFTWSFGGATFSSIYAVPSTRRMQTPQLQAADQRAPSAVCCGSSIRNATARSAKIWPGKYLHGIGHPYSIIPCI